MAILTSFSVLFALVFTWIRKPTGGFIAILLKALATLMILFMTVKVLKIAPDLYVGLPALFMLAMGFSLAGDIFIDLKAAVPQKSAGFLMLGFLSFFAAQIFLISAFISISQVYYSIFFISLTIAIIAHFVFVRFMKYQMQGFVTISSIYTAALLAVSMQTGIMAYTSDWQILPTSFFIASLLFALSDAVLSQTLFGNKNTKLNIVIVHITYYAAQLLYVWTLFYYISQLTN